MFTLSDFISRQMAWIWLLWLLSQTWITIHIWTPKAERLASTEKLFVMPMYNGLLIDQSMALNRKRNDQRDVKTEVGDKFCNGELNKTYKGGRGHFQRKLLTNGSCYISRTSQK